MPDSTRLFRFSVGEGITCPDGLTGILYYVELMLLRQRHEGFHVGALTEQVHGNDRFRARRDSPTHRFHIHVHRLPIHIHYHRRET